MTARTDEDMFEIFKDCQNAGFDADELFIEAEFYAEMD
jgi:hypothetical protein